MTAPLLVPDPPPAAEAPAEAPARELNRRRMLEKNLQRQSEWIRNTDTKISMLLPINTALLAVLASQLDQAHLTVHWLLVIATSIPSLISFASAVFAAMPQFRPGTGSLIYFADVAHQTPEAYRDSVARLTADAHFDDLAAQVHYTAMIARSKYHHVRNAYWSLLIALPFWLAAIYLLNHPGS